MKKYKLNINVEVTIDDDHDYRGYEIDLERLPEVLLDIITETQIEMYDLRNWSVDGLELMNIDNSDHKSLFLPVNDEDGWSWQYTEEE